MRRSSSRARQLPDESDPQPCAAVAAALADLSSQPLVALDADHRIRLLNAPMESLLGVSRAEALGRRFEEVCASVETVESAAALVREALAGERRGGLSRTAIPGGAHLSVAWEFTRVTTEDATALLAIARSWTERPAAPVSFADDVHYEISTLPDDFGLIRSVWGSRPDAQQLVGQRCFEALGRRLAVCPGCPALKSSNDEHHLAVVPLPGSDGSFNVVTVEGTTRTTARIGSRRVSAALRTELLAARVNEIAARQRLSARERQVLHALLSGRSGEEIARELGISQRTVKFHQANVLAKLGADSRVDLLRLIF